MAVDRIYLGMEFEILNRKDSWESITHLTLYLLCGFSIPIPKYNISIEANVKVAPLLQSEINIGVGYLF